jgi:hypothetical protein
MSCPSKLSYADCENLLLVQSVEEIEKIVGHEKVNMPMMKKIVEIVERFIKKKKCICYGGTAINNILPPEDQFYDHDFEIPDYDFFSDKADTLAIELADEYHRAGFKDIVAQAGIHYGTYKVFVNFVPVADITYIPTDLFQRLKKESIVVDDIYYCPPDYLRMSMYLELSRPRGDVSRWEKVLKRLNLLNKHYPIDNVNCTTEIMDVTVFDDTSKKSKSLLFKTVRDFCKDREAVFFGAFAYNYYSKKYNNTALFSEIPNYDVFLMDVVDVAPKLKEAIEQLGEFETVELFIQEPYIDIIGQRASIYVDGQKIITMYEPTGCHSYHDIRFGVGRLCIASIDTILCMYFIFQYTNEDPTIIHRLVCMCHYLFEIQRSKRPGKEEVLRRFSLPCYGTQHTLESLRSIKLAKFIELYKYKHRQSDPRYEEYNKWFLKYIPLKDNVSKPKAPSKAKTPSKSLTKSRFKSMVKSLNL